MSVEYIFARGYAKPVFVSSGWGAPSPSFPSLIRGGVLVGWLMACMCSTPGRGAAQEGPFAFQIRGGATAALGGFLKAEEGWEKEAGPGTSFGMGFTLPLFRAVGGYLGFSQHRFSCDAEICPEGRYWISTGFDVALRVVLGRAGIRPWFQGGVHTHRLEGKTFGWGGVEKLHSDGGGGYEAGAGVLIQMGERMSLSPGLRYGHGNVPFTRKPNMKLSYLVADLGLVVGF